MADMEKTLAQSEAAAELETEIKMPSHLAGQVRLPKRTNKPKRQQTQKTSKVGQVLGKCERCGYISSQRTCHACTLLEGLNKNRPKAAIELELDAEEEESSTTLRRQMEQVQLAG
jgi:cytoplasmic tRNA 2-thiolation protein 1